MIYNYIPMHILMASNPYRISREQRKDMIVDYIKRNPYNEEKDVLKYCKDEGIGSKVTVNEAIKELLAEDILNPGKERKNSKSYRLSVNSDNLLLIIPKDLDEIFKQFKVLIDKVKKQNKREKSTNRIYLPNNKKDKEDNIDPKKLVSLLQYDVMEIINDVYLFYFVVILPHKLENKDQINKLYSYYFGEISKMYSYIASDSWTKKQPFNINNIQQSIFYKKYVESKKQNLHGKLYEVAKICEKINMENDLYNLLRLLWSKNKGSFILLYELIEASDTKLLSKEKDQNLNGVTIYGPDKILEKFLNDIKRYKDKFVLRIDALQLPEGFGELHNNENI